MNKMYETIVSLCEDKGITGYRLCKDTGIRPSVLTDLKMGRQNGLSSANAQKIATYFGVTVGYLLGEETKNAPADDGKRITDKYNIVKIAARNGGYLEKRLSDDDLAVITRIIDTLPDASDDL